MAMKTRHGHAARSNISPEYRCWQNMLQRCTNPNSSPYPYYGGRGIAVCERWMQFENFLADMGPRPSTKHSIDRMDSNGHYEARNCRWATRREQAQTQRPPRSRKIIKGKSIQEWAETWGISYDAARERFARQRRKEKAAAGTHPAGVACPQGQ